jgi:hypothetical protein
MEDNIAVTPHVHTIYIVRKIREEEFKIYCHCGAWRMECYYNRTPEYRQWHENKKEN